jgi:threonine dehydratase
MGRYVVDLNDIRSAAARIKPHIHHTPLITSKTLDILAGRNLFFKCENLQRCGAFKARGSVNGVLSLSEETAAPGVAANNSGNHGQALAYAAGIRGIRAHIAMPSNAPIVKRDAVESYGGQVYGSEPTLEGREATLREVLEQTGATRISAYNDPAVIAGQGTVALELLDQANNLDALLVPVGGGGLVSGVTLAIRELNSRLRVFAAEPHGADDAYRSKAENRCLPSVDPHTVADGLLASMGDLIWPVLRNCVEAVIRVNDDEILRAMRCCGNA